MFGSCLAVVFCSSARNTAQHFHTPRQSQTRRTPLDFWSLVLLHCKLIAAAAFFLRRGNTRGTRIASPTVLGSYRGEGRGEGPGLSGLLEVVGEGMRLWPVATFGAALKNSVGRGKSLDFLEITNLSFFTIFGQDR